MTTLRYGLAACLSMLCWLGVSASAPAADTEKADDRAVKIAEGKLQLSAPEAWKRVKPQSGIVEHEFAVSAAEGDEQGGRVTVMGAGGSVDANIDRWFGQFTQPDGGDTKTKFKDKLKKLEISGVDVHLVDIAGTYKDQRGPFNPAAAVEREKYRMLAAVISSPKLGNYFIKFYGPERTVADNAKGFDEMIRSLKKN